MKFTQFILHQTENKRLLIILAIVLAIQFAAFKYFYPYPNFMPPDSNSYIEAAANNQFINLWPIGYSKFLRLFSCFTTSHWILVLFQFLFLHAALMYLLFTIHYFMRLDKWLFRGLLAISIMNPVLVHISNFISSDAMFTALSLIWLTQLIWIIYQPGQKILLMHAVIVLLAFMVRFNALYYPLISLMAIWFTQLPSKEKKLGIASLLFLLLIFIGHTQYEYQQKTGTVKFSAFAGWQLAANALSGYAHAQPLPTERVPGNFKKLHALVNHHIDSLKQLRHRPDEESGIYYLWDQKAPLIVHMNQHFRRDSTSDAFKRRAQMESYYSSYGWYLIKTKPGAFLQNYIFPNLLKFYSPPAGFMGWYNRGDKTVAPVVANWFGWKDNKVYNRFGNIKITAASYFSVLIAVVNLVFILSGAAFLMVTGFKQSTLHGGGIFWWISVIWLTNMLFSIWASPIELRYQLFPMVITVIFDVLFISWLIQWGRSVASINEKKEKALPQPI